MIEDDEHESGIAIYDEPPDGMTICIPMAPGVETVLHISDEQAEFIVKVLQNKLNGRFT